MVLLLENRYGGSTEMIKLTFLYAIALIIVGIAGYRISDAASVTALIPAFIGAVFLVLGWIGRNEKLRKHMMHIASLLSLLAVFGTFMGIQGAINHLCGGEVERPLAEMSRAITALLSLTYFACCLNSFIQARRNRTS